MSFQQHGTFIWCTIYLQCLVELPGGFLSAFLGCTVVPAGFGLFIRLQ